MPAARQRRKRGKIIKREHFRYLGNTGCTEYQNVQVKFESSMQVLLIYDVVAAAPLW